MKHVSNILITVDLKGFIRVMWLVSTAVCQHALMETVLGSTHTLVQHTDRVEQLFFGLIEKDLDTYTTNAAKTKKNSFCMSCWPFSSCIQVVHDTKIQPFWDSHFPFVLINRTKR